MLVLLRDGTEVLAERVTVTHGGALELRHDFGDRPFMLVAPERWETATRQDATPA